MGACPSPSFFYCRRGDRECGVRPGSKIEIPAAVFSEYERDDPECIKAGWREYRLNMCEAPVGSCCR